MDDKEIIALWKKGFTIKQLVKEYVSSNNRKGNKISSIEAQRYIEPIIFKFQTNLMKEGL